jgi:hypothetical protein
LSRCADVGLMFTSLNEGKHPMRPLNLKNVCVNFLRCFIVAATLFAWGGASAQTTA